MSTSSLLKPSNLVILGASAAGLIVLITVLVCVRKFYNQKKREQLTRLKYPGVNNIQSQQSLLQTDPLADDEAFLERHPNAVAVLVKGDGMVKFDDGREIYTGTAIYATRNKTGKPEADTSQTPDMFGPPRTYSPPTPPEENQEGDKQETSYAYR